MKKKRKCLIWVFQWVDFWYFFFVFGFIIKVTSFVPVVLHVNQNSGYGSFIRETLLPIISDNYYPTFWCWEARMQTVFASFIRATLPNIHYRREILRLSDGGEVVLDWRDNGASHDTPIVLFLPGLTGHSQSEYIKSLNNVAKDVNIFIILYCITKYLLIFLFI